jgi:hypothetical protein
MKILLIAFYLFSNLCSSIHSKMESTTASKNPNNGNSPIKVGNTFAALFAPPSASLESRLFSNS